MSREPVEDGLLVRERPAPAPSARTAPDNPHPEQTAAAMNPPDPIAAPADRAPQLRVWPQALCALVALAGAVVALAAPSLRPVLVAQAPAVLGPAAASLAEVLTPETETDRALAELQPRIAGIEAEVMRLRMELGRLGQLAARADGGAAEAQRAAAVARAGTESSASRVAAIDADMQALSARVHATSLLAAATRLRRDIDAGAPLSDTVALLDLNGPYPAPVAAAMDTLRRYPDGVVTMRDLAVEFEALDREIMAEIGLETASWWRFRALFGTPDDPRLSFLERVRALAAEGRMAEVATMLGNSPWRSQAERWIGQAHQRTAAARSAQVIAAYSLAQAQAARGLPASVRQ